MNFGAVPVFAFLSKEGPYALLGPAEWRVIDFREQGTQPIAEKNYISVVFREAFQEADVRFSVQQADGTFKPKVVRIKCAASNSVRRVTIAGIVCDRV
ncbi:hypothetical protein CAOG_009832 [Capsaspora owczarzaki ATCC 30864]|uniref:Uncharacterized protein n=1 Tax=Capsaspora owczarzaki (strain ATCC 30864) TaxID=595528 RepID=A0A0D2WSY4_CAPO3|nr:hypothetical protein CAOG_009832 [Capsaspora owczarzaki ATCC 30864]